MLTELYSDEELEALKQRSRLPNEETCRLVEEIRHWRGRVDDLEAQIAHQHHAPHAAAPKKAAKKGKAPA